MTLPDLGCACATIRRAARIVSQLYADELRSSGLEGPQYSLLAILHHRPGSSQVKLGRALALDKTTLSRNLKLLQKNGWIVRVEADDQREHGYELSRAGKKLLESAGAGWRSAQTKLRAGLTEAEWESMWQVFQRVSEAAMNANQSADSSQ